MNQYPVNLVLAGRPCLVVGGGAVAARKVAGLRACGAQVHVVAPRVDAEIRAMAADGVTFEERPYKRGEVEDYRLVVAATDDPAVNRAIYDDGETAGVWVNSADDPASCSFTLPAIVRRGPVMVTVSTGGRSPALSSWLKVKVETDIGPEYGVLDDLTTREHLTEALVLSTCMRTEIYAVAARFHGAILDVRTFLAEWSDTSPDEFADHLYSYYEDSAVAHLFKVASGLDSAVIGEGEILGQVKDAWHVAREERAAGPVLSGLFRHAVEVGKRV